MLPVLAEEPVIKFHLPSLRVLVQVLRVQFLNPLLEARVRSPYQKCSQVPLDLCHASLTCHSSNALNLQCLLFQSVFILGIQLAHITTVTGHVTHIAGIRTAGAVPRVFTSQHCSSETLLLLLLMLSGQEGKPEPIP